MGLSALASTYVESSFESQRWKHTTNIKENVAIIFFSKAQIGVLLRVTTTYFVIKNILDKNQKSALQSTFFKDGHSRPLSFVFVFSSKHYNFYNKLL